MHDIEFLKELARKIESGPIADKATETVERLHTIAAKISTTRQETCRVIAEQLRDVLAFQDDTVSLLRCRLNELLDSLNRASHVKPDVPEPATLENLVLENLVEDKLAEEARKWAEGEEYGSHAAQCDATSIAALWLFQRRIMGKK